MEKCGDLGLVVTIFHALNESAANTCGISQLILGQALAEACGLDNSPKALT